METVLSLEILLWVIKYFTNELILPAYSFIYLLIDFLFYFLSA